MALAAACAAAACLAEGRGGDLAHDLARSLSRPLGVAALAFLAWAAASALWAPAGTRSLLAWAEFVLPLAAALVLAATLPARMGRHAAILFAGGLMLAAAIVLVDLATGLAMRRASACGRPTSS